ncbi:hypothetical protein [Desulfoluna spongiiphila]|uniref:Uncharacterized protein n=1 Tax=Desulfoluna spongiiphila TaxID=419481 RepID=A0A1G5HJ27_9BACT|nr:hypothetical protein [Desulfoluna spongiiphila]SCY63892.1 hypothetical protein SAMN05216233_11493 [Desulfoluna spongiiphila]VVS93486.1 hypothetical protein DBB_30580 [Desulfoluna spongiiphila]
MNAIESRKTRYEESLEEVTLEALVAAVSESVEPGEEAIIPHVVNRILRQAHAIPAGR